MKLRKDNTNKSRPKRQPFTDKTNTRFAESSINSSNSKNSRKVLKNQRKLKGLIANDPKLGLRVSVRCGKISTDVIDNLKGTPRETCNLKRFVSIESNFGCKPKLHLQHLNLMNNSSVQTKSKLSRLIVDDPKFNLNVKVHLERFNLKNSTYVDVCNKNGVVKVDKNGIEMNKKQKLSKGNVKNIPIYTNVKSNDKSHDLKDINLSNKRKSATTKTIKSKLSSSLLNVNEMPPNQATVPVSRSVNKKTTTEVIDVSTIEPTTSKNPSSSKLDSKLPKVNIRKRLRVKPQNEKVLQPVKKTANKDTSKGNSTNKRVNSHGQIKKALRSRKTKNYAELSSSFKDSPNVTVKINNSFSEHVPVYLQNILKSPTSKQKDPFEFVPESPQATSKKIKKGRFKKTKDDSSDSESTIYDKSVHEILKNIKRKIKKTKAKKRVKIDKKPPKIVRIQEPVSKKTKTPTIRTVNDSVKEIVEPRTVTKPALKPEVPLSTQSKVLTKQMQFLSQKILDISHRGSRNPVIEKVASDSDDECFGFDDHQDEDDFISLASPNKRDFETHKKLSGMRHIGGNFVSLTSTPLPNFKQIKNNPSTPHKNPKGINIISNVLVSRPHVSPVLNHSTGVTRKTALENDTENLLGFVANNSRTKNTSGSPWRGSHLNVKRNPHFLFIKRSALPCYNQEMVLDSELIERTFSKSMIQDKDLPSSNMVQSSILDYVTSTKTNVESTSVNKPSNNRSLFDNDDFSPIKSATPTKAITVDTRKISSKRNIFSRSPLKESDRDNTSPSNEFAIENYFGFDSTKEDSHNKENYVRTRSKMRTKINQVKPQPTRVNPKEIMQLKTSTINIDLHHQHNNNEQNLTENNERTPEQTVFDSQIEKQDQMPIVGLFEEFETKPLHRSYERKRPRRVRFPSTDSDEAAEEEKPKKRRKGTRTKEEDEQFDKWVQQFNAMCNEVETYNLQTE